MNSGIRHEVASQRRHFRVTAPILIQLGKEIFSTVNWSIVDFKITYYSGPLKVGEETAVEVKIPYQGFEISFPATARVIRLDTADQSLIAEFIHMSEREKAVLEYFVSGLLRDDLENIDGMLRRMDTPVTPAILRSDRAPTPEEIAAETRKRRIGTAFYLIAGVVFTVILAIVSYTNFFQLKIRTAEFVSPYIVEAYLTREEALSVLPGDDALVHFPTDNMERYYRVDKVDYPPRGAFSQERNVIVHLTCLERSKKVSANVAPGTLAEVIFFKHPFGR